MGSFGNKRPRYVASCLLSLEYSCRSFVLGLIDLFFWVPDLADQLSTALQQLIDGREVSTRSITLSYDFWTASTCTLSLLVLFLAPPR